MEKYRGKYRIPSARWAAWDYASNGAYFITICTAHREHRFGVIANGTIIFSPLGRAALDCWNGIPAHFPFVVLDEFVVMPNHVHGIVVIDKSSAAIGTPNHFGPQSQNLASVVRGYKIGVTQYARQNDLPFEWQERYHDHVIRNEGEYHRICQYICENPQRWADDMYYAAEN